MIIVTRDLGCDGDDCPMWTTGGTDVTATEIRRMALGRGWSRRNGRDLCEECTRRAEL